jgi:serine/threonine-protein kinase
VSSEDEALAAERVGDVLGRWKLDAVLGIGGMATVYAATSVGGERGALKLLHPEMIVRADVRERFLREVHAVSQVGHAGVPRILDHGSDGTHGLFLVMELLEGESLGALVRRAGSPPVPRLLEWADQILDVLAAAHAQHIIHRDLKPDNVFVTRAGPIKVLDFGIARIHAGAPGELRTRTGLALGTAPYMAPEQALGRTHEIDGRVDVFALGATLFRVVSGRRIHEAPSEAELLMSMASKPAPPLLSVAPHVPRDFARIVDRALAFRAQERYPSALAMQSDVRALLAGRALATPSFELPTRPGTPASGAHADAPTRLDRAPSPARAGLPATLPGEDTLGSSGKFEAALSPSAVLRLETAQTQAPLTLPPSTPIPAPARTGFTVQPAPLKSRFRSVMVLGAVAVLVFVFGAASATFVLRTLLLPEQPAAPARERSVASLSDAEPPASGGEFDERAGAPPSLSVPAPASARTGRRTSNVTSLASPHGDPAPAAVQSAIQQLGVAVLEDPSAAPAVAGGVTAAAASALHKKSVPGPTPRADAAPAASGNGGPASTTKPGAKPKKRKDRPH